MLKTSVGTRNEPDLQGISQAGADRQKRKPQMPFNRSVDGIIGFIDLSGSPPHLNEYKRFGWKAWFTATHRSTANPFGELESANMQFTGHSIEVRIGGRKDKSRPRLFSLEQAADQDASELSNTPLHVELGTWLFWLMLSCWIAMVLSALLLAMGIYR